MSEEMNIYQKLIKVREAVPYLKKSNQGYQYSYTGSSQVLSSIREKIDELQLLLIPQVLDTSVSMETVEGQDKNGNPKKTTTFFTELSMNFTWVNAEKPEETITCPWYGQGIDTAGEKGVGKALTYAEKYFILKFFNIATDTDDPDAFQEKTNTHDKESKQQTSKSSTDEGKITTEEAKQLYKLTGQDEDLFRKVLNALGYLNSTDIDRSMYQRVVEKIGELKGGE